eukprot:8955579-Ditylum_brightwellii.AAC.1
MEYWIDALNRGIVTIATNGSVSNKKGYCATVLSSYSRSLITNKQTLLCDNAAAVFQTNAPVPPGIKQYVAADYNIVKEIEVVMKSRIDMQAEWVKAHQDNTTEIQLLPIEAQLKVQADADVTSFHLNIPTHLQPSPTPVKLTSTRATLIINNITVTSNLHKIIWDN